MDDARALLDSLMGPSRNQKEEKKKKNGKPDFAERNICKNFLVGFCPHDWFTVKKRELEPCTKVHSEYLKGQFEAHPDVEKFKAQYEDEFLAYLEKVMGDCDKYIARERIKCRDKGAGGEKLRMPKADQEKCADLEAKYAALIKEAEEAAEESVTKAGELTEQATAAKDQIEALRARHTHEFPGEEVCEVCGVRYALAGGGLSEFHGKESHLNGKIHLGYTEIRTKVGELRGTKRLRERELDKEREKEREEREKKKDEKREKDKDKEREKEREEREKKKDEKREKEKDKDKEKEKAADKEGEKEKDKDREKEKDREKDKDREKEKGGKDKDRSREKSRSRSRDKGKAKGKDRKDRSRSRSKDKGKSKGRDTKKDRSRSARRRGGRSRDRRRAKASSSERARSRSKAARKSGGGAKGKAAKGKRRNRSSSESS